MGGAKNTIMYIGLHVKYPLFFSDLNETWTFFTDFRKKYWNVKFHENPSSGSRVVPCEQTNTTKLTVAFRSFANAPNNWYFDGHFD